MKRIAVLTLLLALGAAWSTTVQAQESDTSKSAGQSEKSIQKQQKALYLYQKKQEKAQAKAQRTSDKQQKKAAKKYDKQQHKLLKNSNLPAKHAS
jgi:hypothetical protein